MENKLSEQESLRIINEMIAQARGRLEKGDGKYFLLWGYVVFIASLTHFLTLNEIIPNKISLTMTMANLIWLTSSTIGIAVTIYFILKDRKKVVIKTYTGEIINTVWIGFGVCAFIIPYLLGNRFGILIYPAISLIYCFTLLVSAKAYRIKSMFISVAVCFICLILYKFVTPYYFPLLMAVIILSGNIIPGHIINYKAARNV